MCYGIEKTMKELHMSFSEVFELFQREKIFIRIGKFFGYNLRGHKAIKADKK
jgi:hypothetical protein